MKLLIIIGVVLIFLLFVIIYLQIIKLLLIRIFYSSYSSKYIKAFKSLYNKSPFGYCIKDEFVYHVLPFREIEKDTPKYKTNIDICFEKIPFYTTYKKLRKLKGRPSCFHAYKIAGHCVKICGYSDPIIDSSARTLYYFVDNVFFMGESVFKKADERTLDFIISSIKSKYLADEIEGKNKFYIKRSDNSKIYYHDNGFSVIISYVNLEDDNIKNTIFGIIDRLDDIRTRIKKKNEKYKGN